MAHIDIPEGEGPERLRLWELAPAMGGAIDAFRTAVYVEGTLLSIREREVSRMRIAQINECDI